MSSRIAVVTAKAPMPSAIMSQAIICNGMVYCAGSLGIDPETNKFVEGGPYERTIRSLRNLDQVLQAAGSDIRKAVKVNIFLSSMDHYDELNRAYGEIFDSANPKPARTCVCVAKLPMDAEMEIELIATL